MKKVLIGLLIALSLIVTLYSQAIDTTAIALNTSTYTAITVTKTNGPCRPMSAYTEDLTSFLMAKDSSGTGEVVIPADTFWSDTCVVSTAGIIFYAKATAGTPNLAVFVGATK